MYSTRHSALPSLRSEIGGSIVPWPAKFMANNKARHRPELVAKAFFVAGRALTLCLSYNYCTVSKAPRILTPLTLILHPALHPAPCTPTPSPPSALDWRWWWLRARREKSTQPNIAMSSTTSLEVADWRWWLRARRKSQHNQTSPRLPQPAQKLPFLSDII